MNAETVFNDAQMQHRYGAFYALSPKVDFDPADVPDELQALIPYAAFWGLSDDFDRESLVDAAPAEILENLKHILRAHDDSLDDWLAGPQADRPPFSRAYIAFSAMRMAADFA